jgi:hypothetical protein
MLPRLIRQQPPAKSPFSWTTMERRPPHEKVESD